MRSFPDTKIYDSRKGIFYIILAMPAVTISDAIVKQLSSTYALHELILIRSGIALLVSLAILQFHGGFQGLRTRQPGLHLIRCLLCFVMNMAFFGALAALPLADTTALFFVAPLFITFLSVPLLGEKVGLRRILAVMVGFLGVVIMFRPGSENLAEAPHKLVYFLPVTAALCYAIMQILTRRLGATSSAAAMAVYVQGTFFVASLLFWLTVGDGRYADTFDNPSLRFLLRAWIWPSYDDVLQLLALGLVSAIVGYAFSEAYRSAEVATVAPFEYVALPLSVLWGFLVFGDLPDLWVTVGIILIGGSGLYVFLRERGRSRT